MATIYIEYGSYKNMYTYMGWQLITAKDTLQYKLKEEAGMNFDSEGFGVINGRYVIACTPTFGQVGDEIDWTLANGSVLHTIIGEMKSSRDSNYTKWGHVENGYISVVEFVVNRDTWYPSHANPGTPSCHPEWAGQIQKADIVGNYWTGDVPIIDQNGAGNGNMYLISAERYFNGQYYQCSFTGSIWADGYVYFNDVDMFRCYNDGSNLQLFYYPKQIWIRTSILKNINLTLANNNGTAFLGEGVEAAVKWMIAIANDDSHGYDQTNRWGPDYDCSSLIYEGFRVGGGFTGLPTHEGYTGSMVKDFTAIGFDWMVGNVIMTQLIRGDIVLNEGKHTECYIGNGQNVGAHINEFGATTGGRTGDQTGREICVGDYWNDNWDGYLEYRGANSTATTAAVNQILRSEKPLTILRSNGRTNDDIIQLRYEVADMLAKGTFNHGRY